MWLSALVILSFFENVLQLVAKYTVKPGWWEMKNNTVIKVQHTESHVFI